MSKLSYRGLSLVALAAGLGLLATAAVAQQAAPQVGASAPATTQTQAAARHADDDEWGMNEPKDPAWAKDPDEAREKAFEAREKAMEAREKALEAREDAMEARDDAADAPRAGAPAAPAPAPATAPAPAPAPAYRYPYAGGYGYPYGGYRGYPYGGYGPYGYGYGPYDDYYGYGRGYGRGHGRVHGNFSFGGSSDLSGRGWGRGYDRDRWDRGGWGPWDRGGWTPWDW